MTKGSIPTVLRRHGSRWTRELLDAIQAGVVTESLWSKYRHPEIKAQLEVDSYQKCIYCESRITHVAFGHIEHLAPKRRFPRLTYEWRNLGLGCDRCNNAKGDQYDEAQPPVNPYEEDPDRYFLAVGELVWPLPGNDRGIATVAVVGLNRPQLLETRRRRLEGLRALAEAASRMSGAAKEAYLEQMNAELEPDREYLFVCRPVVTELQTRILEATE